MVSEAKIMVSEARIQNLKPPGDKEIASVKF